MLFKPYLGDELSGALVDIVASHNKGGYYFRERVTPANPNTIQQQVVRNTVAGLAGAWVSFLTQAQRDGWQVYADNVPLTNRLGDARHVSGMAMWIRGNLVPVAYLFAARFNAPGQYNLGTFQPGAMDNATAAAQTVDFNFDNDKPENPWAREVGSFMVVFLSRPQKASIKFFRGPYRFAGAIQGTVGGAGSPFSVAAPFVFVAGDRLFGRTIVSYVDGRMTSDAFATTLAVA